MWRINTLVLCNLALILLVCPRSALCEAITPYDSEPSANYSQSQLETLAKKIGISKEIEVIKRGESSEQIYLLRAENVVNKKVASAYFDCSAVEAESLQEESDLRERKNALEAKRNAKVLTINSANFLSRGAISAPALGYSINPNHLPTKGNELGSVANGTSTLLSLVAIAESRGGKSTTSSGPSILAPLFFPELPHERITPYVWIYLNSSPLDLPADSQQTHITRLVAKWVKAKLAPDPANADGKQKLRRLLEIDSTGLTIGELNKREEMLKGFKTTVLQMNKGLEQLSHWI